MKRLATFILVIMLIVCGTVLAEDGEMQIDGAALNWYAQAVTAAFEPTAAPLSMLATELDGYWLMEAYYDVDYDKSATIEEVLSGAELPCDLAMTYDSYDNRIVCWFPRKAVIEIPHSVEVYADGQQLIGMVNIQPEKIDVRTEHVGFGFLLEEVGFILNADDVFMRLVTDKGTSFIDLNSETTMMQRVMLLLVYSGARYSSKSDEYYLDKTHIWEQIRDWQPQNESTVQSATVSQKSFQTDYEAIDKAAQASFLLEVYDHKDQRIATGSGFMAFDKGTLITNEHVIDGAAYVIAYSDQYRNQYKLTELKAVDKEADIAILKFDEKANVQPLSVDCNAKIFRGQPVTAIGSPQGILNTVSIGNISNIVYYSEDIPDYIQFTAPISPGSSGGALFNEQGKVIGLCVSYLKEGEAMYYAIPIKYVESLFKTSIGKELTSLVVYNKLSSSKFKCQLKPPEITARGIKLTWNGVADATKYAVYRRDVAKGKFIFISYVWGESYTDVSAKIGKTYDYYILMYSATGSETSNQVRIKRTK